MALSLMMKIELTNIDKSAYRLVTKNIERNGVVGRIFRKDHTVWKDRDEEIGNRLGWLDAPERFAGRCGDYEAFAASVRSAGFRRVLLLGMGGSSLAPEVLSRICGPGPAGLPLDVLDSTDPAAVLRFARELDFARTLFLVSSKSGTTLETTALMNFFFSRTEEALGRDNAGSRFVAITDPGSGLESEARRRGFRAVFAGDPEIGGRFSVFSSFGLLPTALLGMETGRLLASARAEMAVCRAERTDDNPAALVGAVLGTLASAGRDKVAFLLSSPLGAFGAWLEQLIAESTGKDGRGILPLVRSTGASFDRPAEDKVFISMSLGEDPVLSGRISALAAQGAPLVSLRMESPDDLGGQFYFWEFATAVAGAVLGINPFDQPNVALSKKKTEGALQRPEAEGGQTDAPPPAKTDKLILDLDGEAGPLEAGLRKFLDGRGERDYLAVQAFLPPFHEVEAALGRLAERIADRTGRPVAYDFGPRFLHSTGQIHKGDAGRGLFLQLTASHAEDIPVPGAFEERASPLTFGRLIDAQARGDREALREKRRRIAHVHIEGGIVAGLRRLADAVT